MCMRTFIPVNSLLADLVSVPHILKPFKKKTRSYVLSGVKLSALPRAVKPEQDGLGLNDKKCVDLNKTLIARINEREIKNKQ